MRQDESFQKHGGLKKKSIGKAVIATMPMLIFTALITFGQMQGGINKLENVATIITYIFINGIFFLMLYTGKIDRYRAMIFIATSFCFVLSFFVDMIEMRGSVALSTANFYEGKTPFCHIVIPMLWIPIIVTKTIIFPGTLMGWKFSILTMIIIWTGATLAIGRGWCAWMCFFGGLEDGFSRILKKPIIKKINPKWAYMPFAILIVLMITSAISLSPTYCGWLCPFKAVTEFEKVTSVVVLIQTVIFVTLFLGLVVVLPILTKKRTQCSFLCPFGAMQSLLDFLNPFNVKIDKEKCINCKKCINECPTFSIDENSISKGRTNLMCTKCGKCIDNCPKSAISYKIKGTSPKRANVPKMLFLYPAYLLLSIFSVGMISTAVYRIALLITTGSIFVK